MSSTVARTVGRGIAALILTAGLACVLQPVAVAAANPSPATTSDTANPARCAQIRQRLAGAPATLRRVDVNLAELEARLSRIRLPARRAAVEARIQRLEQLRTALADRIADARAACRATTT